MLDTVKRQLGVCVPGVLMVYGPLGGGKEQHCPRVRYASPSSAHALSVAFCEESPSANTQTRRAAPCTTNCAVLCAFCSVLCT